MNKSIGYVTIKQSRNIVSNGEGGQFKLTTALSSPQNFPDYILVTHPDYIFIYKNNEFQYIGTLVDIKNIPIDEPASFDGLYRKNMLVQYANSEKEAASISRGIVRSLEKVYLNIYDYVEPLKDTTEEGVVPDITSTEFYQGIQDYLKKKKEIDEAKVLIREHTASKQVLEKVLNIGNTGSKVSTQATNEAKTTMLALGQTIAEITGKLATVNIETSLATINKVANLYSNGTVPTLIKNINALIDEENNNGCECSKNGGNCESSTGSCKSGVIGMTQDLTAQATGIKASLNGVTDSLATSVTTIATVKDTLTHIVPSVAGPLNNINNAIKSSIVKDTQIQTVYLETLGKLKSAQNLYDGLMAELQRIGGYLVSIEPEIDLDDPMAIYNHRFFKLVPEEGSNG